MLLCVGPRTLRLAEQAANITDKKITIVNCRSVKPLDEDFLIKLGGKNVITLEENVSSGGFGSAVAEFFVAHNIDAKLKIYAFPDVFVKHAETQSQTEKAGFTPENIVADLK